VLPVVTVRDAQAASFNLDDYARSGLVLFATYSVFSRGESSPGLKKLRELLADCGKEYEFEGVIAFDEAHNAKNLVPGRGKASKTGQHVKLLQDDFPSARIVYASATGASEVRNMGYMTRLGLWGEGTPFSDFHKPVPGKRYPAFLPELNKGGYGAMELVGMDLKAQGRYLCRTLSFKGASFEVSEAKLDVEQVKVYDEAAALWQRLIVICKNGRFWAPIADVNLKTFWAAQQLFFRQLLCAFKVKHTVSLIKKALDQDRSVIVGIQLTGDSRVQEMLKELMKGREEAEEKTENADDQDGQEGEEEEAEGGKKARRPKKRKAKAKAKKRATGPGELDDAFSSTKETFCRLVENCWASTEKILLSEVRELKAGKRTASEILQKPGSHQLSEAQVRRHSLWKDLADKTDKLKFPVNPIDGIVQAFGSDMVAEVTGRRLRAEMRDGGRVEYVSRAKGAGATQAKLNLSEQLAFVTGKKRVIIISQAGSSGISLHAGFDYDNQQPRTHIILELPWSSEQLIQQCGRTHRSNQVSAPEFIAISTNVAGETRFAMSVAARMQSLGALTKSDRRAAHASSRALSRFDFVTTHGRNALRDLQSKTQVQALARLADGRAKRQHQQQQRQPQQPQPQQPPQQLHHHQQFQQQLLLHHQQQGLHGLPQQYHPATAQQIMNESEKREHLRELGLQHENAPDDRVVRDRFIARAIVCFVDRQMADRELKMAATHIRKAAIASPQMKERYRRAEKLRDEAEDRLCKVKNAHEGICGPSCVPVEWTHTSHTKFPLPVKRAITELLRVFKMKENEWGRLPPVVMSHIFSFIAVGKPPGAQKAGVSSADVGWLHPPEPGMELFCLLLLLDVVKAPPSRRNSDVHGSYDMTYGNEKPEKNKLTIETFFNRMLAMSTTWQKRVFAYFMDLHENELAEAEAAGETSAVAGVTEVGVGNCKASLVSEQQICEDESGSPVMHLSISCVSGDQRLDFGAGSRKLKESGELVHQGGQGVVERAVQLAESGATNGPSSRSAPDTPGAVVGFYQQKRSKRIVLVAREGSRKYAIWRPNSRKTPEKRRLTFRDLCERLKRFDPLPESAARAIWVQTWMQLGNRTTEKYHLITGPVLACWHVIKDCAARVVNEGDTAAAPGGEAAQAEKEDASDKPDTTLSIVRAVLTDGRRIIGLQIEESNVDYVVSELQRQHQAGWEQPEQVQNVGAADLSGQAVWPGGDGAGWPTTTFPAQLQQPMQQFGAAVQAAPAQAYESAGVETGPEAAQQVQPSYDLAAVW